MCWGNARQELKRESERECNKKYKLSWKTINAYSSYEVIKEELNVYIYLNMMLITEK